MLSEQRFLSLCWAVLADGMVHHLPPTDRTASALKPPQTWKGAARLRIRRTFCPAVFEGARKNVAFFGDSIRSSQNFYEILTLRKIFMKF
jgi:hypothetical protein